MLSLVHPYDYASFAHALLPAVHQRIADQYGYYIVCGFDRDIMHI